LPDSITHILTLAEQFSNNDLFALSIFLLTKNYLDNCLPSWWICLILNKRNLIGYDMVMKISNIIVYLLEGEKTTTDTR
jgi:hypothetical protein